MFQKALNVAARRMVMRSMIAPMTVARSSCKMAVAAATPRMPIRSYSSQGLSDMELAQVLKKEVEYEKQAAEEEGAEASQFLADFKKQGTWSIQDKDGSNEVKLVRSFGKEKIAIYFSTNDLNENIEDAEDPEAEDGLGPIPVTVVIDKPSENVGAIQLTGEVYDDVFEFTNIVYIPSSTLAAEDTVEADWKRRDLYAGPLFETLDESVQEKMLAYMEERGFNAQLAEFIGMYAEHKELNEYQKWLSNVQKFVSA